jgi:hypothetical protein
MSTATESEQLLQYRSISSLAVVALLFGLASPLALVNPLLLAVPLAAVILALFALRQIAANEEVLSGRNLALVAVFLGVTFLFFTPVRLATRYEILKGHARELAEAFLDLLQKGQLYEAHQLAQLKYVTPGPDSPPEEYAQADKMTVEDFAKFKETKSIQNIEAVKSNFTYRFEAVEPTPARDGGEFFVLRYQIVPDGSLGKRPFPIWISISRTRDESSVRPKWKWKIYDMQHTFKQE